MDQRAAGPAASAGPSDADGRAAAIAGELLRFIADVLCGGTPPAPLEPATDLIAAGILDSMALVQVVGFIEERFGLRVGDSDLTPEHFSTVAAMAAYLAHRLAAA